MDYHLDGTYHCDTCGYDGRVPRSLVVRNERPLPKPVVGRINDELIFVQFHNTVMIFNEEQAAEVVDSLIEELVEVDEFDAQQPPAGCNDNS